MYTHNFTFHHHLFGRFWLYHTQYLTYIFYFNTFLWMRFFSLSSLLLFFKTKADILAFETLEQVVEGKHNELWDFPNVRSLWIRVRESSNVANYLISKQRMIQTKEDAVQYKKSVNKTMGR